MGRDLAGLVRAPHGHPHTLVLDLDLPHATLLDDLDELADSLGALGILVLGDQDGGPGMPPSNHLQELLRIGAEHREQHELLLTRRQSVGALAHVLRRRRVVSEHRLGREQGDGPLDAGVDRLGRDAVTALDEGSELVDHRSVTPGVEDVQESLGGENLADRSRERRKSSLGADASDLLENVEQAVGRAMRPKMNLERGDEAGGKVVFRGANGDAGRDRRHRLVPDELVDDVGGLPELVHVEPGGLPDSLERLGERLARHAVQRQRERVDRGRDEVRPRFDGGERRGEPHARCTLDVEADGQLARLPDPRDQLGRAIRGERAGRVVDDDARGAELGQLARLLDQRVRLAGSAGAVHEPGVERPTGARDRGARLPEVRDVVQRVVQPEDLDAVLGGACHEATDDVSADRPRADQEPSAERDPQRSRDARADRADSLPRALDAPPYGRVEDAAARDLEAREAGPVEDLGNPEHLGRRQPPG